MRAGDSELVNKTEGINLCLKTVEAGSSGAALYLAELFYQGDLVVKNDTFAFEYYKLANPKRNPLAAFRLGQFYDRGIVVEQDVEKSLYWYEMAASHGYSSAYLPCAALYWDAYEQLSEDRAKTLAKTYLWISAAEVANDSLNVDSYDRNKIEDIALLRNAVLKEMPNGWQSRLDKQVAEHFLNLDIKG